MDQSLEKFRYKNSLFLLLLFTTAGYAYSSPVLTLTTADVEKTIQQMDASNGEHQGEFIQTIQAVGDASIAVIRAHLTISPSTTKQVLLSGLLILKAPCNQVQQQLPRQLEDPLWLVRYNALMYIGAAGCKDLRENVLNTIRTERENQVKGIAIEALGFIGNSDDIVLLTHYQSEATANSELRLSATSALVRLQAPYQTQILYDALTSTKPDIRIKALSSLSLSTDKKAEAKIRPLLNDPEVSSWADIAIQGIEINQPDVSNSEKVERLFLLINGDKITLTQWAVHELIIKHQSSALITRLKEIAKRNATNTTMRVEREIILKVMVEEKVLSMQEAREIQGEMYEQPK